MDSENDTEPSEFTAQNAKDADTRSESTWKRVGIYGRSKQFHIGATGINGVPNKAGLQGSDVRPESFDIAFLPRLLAASH